MFKEVSNTIPSNEFDIYEIWNEVKEFGENIYQSETGRWARNVISETGEVIGKILLEKIEEIASDIVTEVAESVVKKVKEKL